MLTVLSVSLDVLRQYLAALCCYITSDLGNTDSSITHAATYIIFEAKVLTQLSNK